MSLREPLLVTPVEAPALTILLDPISGQARVGPLHVRCIAKSEAFAEKFRAALSRREVAVRELDLRTADPALVTLVKRKLAMPGNDPVDRSGVFGLT